MDKVSKALAIFLLIYALIGIAHLMKPKVDKPDLNVQFESVVSPSAEPS